MLYEKRIVIMSIVDEVLRRVGKNAWFTDGIEGGRVQLKCDGTR